MATLTHEFRLIPSLADDAGGDDIYLGVGSQSGGDLLRTSPPVGPVAAHTTVVAPTVFTDQDGRRYAFVFWNVVRRTRAYIWAPGMPVTLPFDQFEAKDDTVRLLVTPSSDVVATAWYVPIAGPTEPPGPPRLTALAFDRGVNRFFRETPIAGVSPGGLWVAGKHDVTTGSSDVVVTAKSPLESLNFSRFRTLLTIIDHMRFEVWRFGGAHAALDLPVKKGGGGLAIAVYRRFSRIIPILVDRPFVIDRPGPIAGRPDPATSPVRAEIAALHERMATALAAVEALSERLARAEAAATKRPGRDESA